MDARKLKFICCVNRMLNPLIGDSYVRRESSLEKTRDLPRFAPNPWLLTGCLWDFCVKAARLRQHPVKIFFLILLLASSAQAQFIGSGSGSNQFGGFSDANATVVPTDTPTWDPSMPTYTPTSTPTYNPFATATDTPTPGSPTDTPTNSFTPTATGTIDTPTPTATYTPVISRASLVMLPTAYSNARDHWDGFNWDIDFTYFIGSIISEDTTKGSNGFDSLNQINIVLLTNDLKYAWLDDNGDRPGIASGLMTSLFAQVGDGSSAPPPSGGAGTGTSAAFQVQGNVIGGVYTVMSKKISNDTAVHFGYIYGLDHLGLGLFSQNYSSLLPYFAPGLSTEAAAGEGPDNLLYMGFNTRFWNRNWKFEIWKPFSTSSGQAWDQNPILFNTQIDGLPMAFNLGYERWDSGFAVLGYLNFRVPLLPSSSDY